MTGNWNAPGPSMKFRPQSHESQEFLNYLSLSFPPLFCRQLPLDKQILGLCLVCLCFELKMSIDEQMIQKSFNS